MLDVLPLDPPKLANTPPRWRQRWVQWRNRILQDQGFQYWAARLPIFAAVSRRRAASAFDLVAGFCYSQVLLAAVQAGLLDLLDRGPKDVAELAHSTGLSRDAALRLVRAAAALDLAEEVAPGCWMLGQQGAALQSNPGALAMVRHHPLLYNDLADPLALLRQDRTSATRLSDFWHYTSETEGRKSQDYSELMAGSQAMVAREALAAYPFARHRRLLDIGGGHGAFVKAVAQACPHLACGVFDLPPVLAGCDRDMTGVSLHPGDFFASPLPTGYDCMSLVRILHDHDDDRCLAILQAARAALPPGGKLVIAEPMSGARDAKAMGDAYFGLYLWAMNSGRPRTAKEYEALASAAGFSRCVGQPTAMPVIASVIVCSY